MNRLKTFFQSVWNFEYQKFSSSRLTIVFVIILIFGLVYVTGEVLFGQHFATRVYTFFHFMTAIQKGASTATSLSLESIFPKLWITLALLVVVVRYTVIIAGFLKSRKVFGDAAFTQSFLTYFTSAMLSLSVSLLIVIAAGRIAGLFGYSFNDGLNIFDHGVKSLTAYIDRRVPSLINIHNYWLALFLTIILSALPNYIIHYMCHRSRLLWYVFHRAHHSPEILHPIGVPEAFNFGVLLTLPFGLLAMVISKLIYTQPLVMEMLIWFLFSYFFEIFNHSAVYYDFAYHNPIVRNMSRLFGDSGVYHQMHHSALQHDQSINFSQGPFNFWDRVFGTYRKPYKTSPPIGLTNQPKIKMNPFRVAFGGIYQLYYEFRNNKNWGIRSKVLFGSIYYKPPVTKDFLIIS